MSAATPGIAVVAKIKGGATSAGARAFAQVNTQEPTLPLVIVSTSGAPGNTRLSGSSSALKPHNVSVDCYATSQALAVALAAQVLALLAPDGTPWRDLANGVQGCFFGDSTEEVLSDESKDTPRVQRLTFTVWHSPT